METWTCHICQARRPDDKISVLSKPLVINGQALGTQNIRYCNDNPECIQKAQGFDLFGERTEGPREVTPEMREALFGIPAKKFYSWWYKLKCRLYRWGLWWT